MCHTLIHICLCELFVLYFTLLSQADQFTHNPVHYTTSSLIKLYKTLLKTAQISSAPIYWNANLLV